MIAIAVVVLVVVIGSVFAYTYIETNSSSPSPTPSPAPTATATPTAHPTSAPTSSPTAAPTSAPTPTPSPTPVPTLASGLQLNGAGGTLVAPLMSFWTVAYNQYQPKVQVNYNAVGSGAGITAFQGQTVDFGESDMPLQTADINGLPSGSTALTIPISASAVVPAYNIRLVNGSICQNGLNFTGTVLANIFLGTITTWNDPAITSLQSSTVAAQLPSATITTIHRSDGSGTMYAFTDYLSQASSAWASGPGKSKSPAWPLDNGNAYGYKGNTGVAQGIEQNSNSIGPLEIAYEIQNSGEISYGAVQNGYGNFVLATIPTIQASLSAGATSLPAGNAVWSSVSVIDSIYNDHTDTNIYPVVTLTYALVYQSQSSYNQGAALVSFLTWVINQGQSYGSQLGYAPLPANIVSIDTATIRLITYQGNQIPLLS